MDRSHKSKSRFSVAVIGCGRIGSLLEEDPLRQKPCTHAGAFAAYPGTEIIAGCDINVNRLERFGKKWRVAHLYGDYRQMLLRERPDIVCVAAWTPLHKEMTIFAARSGARGIFCEKPIALNARDGKRMVDFCEKSGTKLCINHERRYEERYKKAKKIIDRGTLGPIKMIVGNALSSLHAKTLVKTGGGGGYFHDGTHLIDLLLFLAGDPAWVSGFDDRPHGKEYLEETAGAVIAFENGIMAFVEGGGQRKYFNFEVDIQGTKGRLIMGNSVNDLYMAHASPRFQGFQELRRRPSPFEAIPARNLFVNAARDLVESIEKDRAPISSGYDGLRALKIIEATYRSARKGGKRIFFRIDSGKKQRATRKPV